MRERTCSSEGHHRGRAIPEAGGHRKDRHSHAQTAHLFGLRQFVRVVCQRDQFELDLWRERPHDVKGPSPVAAVGCVRQSMSEKQDPHASSDSARSRRLTMRAGTPAATTRSGSGRVTTAPAPTMVSRPTSARTMALLPIQVPAPMRTRRGLPG